MAWKYRIASVTTTPPGGGDLAESGQIAFAARVFDDASGTPPTRAFDYSWQGAAPLAGTLAAFRTEHQQRMRAQANAYEAAKKTEAAVTGVIGTDVILP